MTDLALDYLLSRGAGLEEAIQGYSETQHIHYATQVLADVGDLKRLKKDWTLQVQPFLDRGEAFIRQLSADTLRNIAQSLSVAGLQSKLAELESLGTDEEQLEEGDDLLAILIVDDILSKRDRICSAVNELTALKVDMSPALRMELSIFDDKACNNSLALWAAASVQGHSILYEPAAIEGLWWWQLQAAAVPVPKKTSSPYLLTVLAARIKDLFWPADVGIPRRAAPIAALILLAAVISLWKSPSGPVNIASLYDGSRTISLDKDGNLEGIDPEVSTVTRKAIADVLREPASLLLPLDSLKAINPSPGGPIQMGNDKTFSLKQPIGLVIEDDQPLFTWEAFPGASSYVVTIYEYGGDDVATSKTINDTSWRISASTLSRGTDRLTRGKTYLWQVDAKLPDGKATATTGAGKSGLFKVLDDDAFKSLNQIRTASDSHLARAITYAQFGLIDEAETETKSLKEANPNNPIVSELILRIETAKASLNR